jgi:hypothetical protein
MIAFRFKKKNFNKGKGSQKNPKLSRESLLLTKTVLNKIQLGQISTKVREKSPTKVAFGSEKNRKKIKKDLNWDKGPNRVPGGSL